MTVRRASSVANSNFCIRTFKSNFHIPDESLPKIAEQYYIFTGSERWTKTLRHTTERMKNRIAI